MADGGKRVLHGREVDTGWVLTAYSRMSEVQVCRRLGKCIQFWREELCAPPWVITEGYVLPLMSEPPPYSCPNQQSVQLESEFVGRAMVHLLAGGYEERSSETPTVSTLLSVLHVVSGAGKKWLVVNLQM